MDNSKAQLLKEGNSANTSNCHHISFLTVTPFPELSTDLWPPVTSLLQSCQVLPEPKWSKKNIEIVRNLDEEKHDSSIYNPPNSLPKLVKTMERYVASLNKDQIITDGGAFEYKLEATLFILRL